MRGMASPRSSRMQMMTAHDSQEICVCALVLSVLAFFLFIGAEIVPLDDRGVVFTLVALGTLGFAWIGPLTVLAGIIRYPKFKWWQPFQGGTEFVWMQAIGWSLHAVVLTSAAVVLANARMEKWIQGQYLVMGIAGFIAQVLLNLSIGSFNEQLAELPVVPLEWNTKAVVSMLVSSSSVVLYLIFDVFSEKLQSNIMLYAGVAEFVLSALMIHVFYGCIEIPGYRVWQPFEGGRTFLLLQYLGWQFFAINIVGTMMLCTSSSPSKGAATAVGFTGFISQVVLLISLHHFTREAVEDVKDFPQPSVLSHKRRPSECIVSALLCFGAVCIGYISYLARSSHTRVFPSAYALFVQHEEVLWVISLFAMALATPIANMGAVRSYPGYRWWQPFAGGTKFVFLQTLGWLWYGFFLATVIIFGLNEVAFVGIVAHLALLLGCGATIAVILSLSYYESPRGDFARTGKDALRQRESAIEHGEIAIGLLMCLACTFCHIMCDAFREELNISLRRAAITVGGIVFLLGCGVAHASGRRLSQGYKICQPFEGGGRYVIRQAIGWTLVGVELLLIALTMSIPPSSVPPGFVSVTGSCAIVPHLVLLSSIQHYQPGHGGSMSRKLDTNPSSIRMHSTKLKWKDLVRRPDLLWRLGVNAIMCVGSAALFGFAEGVRQNHQYQHADEVLYAFGCLVSIGGILCAHGSLAPRIQPGYRLFQPFQGGLRFVTFQGVAWTLASIGWVIASTAFYWRESFFKFPGIQILTGTIFVVAQCIIVYSIPLFKYSSVSHLSDPDGIHTHTEVNKLACEFMVGPLLGIAACVVFVGVDVLMLTYGPTLPVLPITVCAVCALFTAIPMSYKFAKSRVGAKAKVLGGSMVFLLLGCALWSFTILLGALYCFRLSGLESHDAPPLPPAKMPTKFMGTLTGSVGFLAQLIFFQATEDKEADISPRKAVGRRGRAEGSTQRRILSATVGVCSIAVFFIGLAYAVASTLPLHGVSLHHMLGVVCCVCLVVYCAFWIQGLIVAQNTRLRHRGKTKDSPTAALSRMESECFAQVCSYLLVKETGRLLATSSEMRGMDTAAFWRRQYIERLQINHYGHAASMQGQVDDISTNIQPTFTTPFTATTSTFIVSCVMDLVCRLKLPSICPFVPVQHFPRFSVWKALCISHSKHYACERCVICGKWEVLSDAARQWETQHGCTLMAPSTWVQMCACIDPITLSFRTAHRSCAEERGMQSSTCTVCGIPTGQSSRYPITMSELIRTTWADFRQSDEDFASGFFVFVPLSTCVVIFSAKTYDLGTPALYVWTFLAMALCFVSHTPRLQASLEHLGPEGSPSYAAYQRLFQALTLSSLAHVYWCLREPPNDILDLLFRVNLALFVVLSGTALVLYWKSGYLVPTVECTFDASKLLGQRTAATNHESSCILCLLQVCSNAPQN